MPVEVIRLSDGNTRVFEDVNANTKVKVLKHKIFDALTPKYERGCRLIINGQVMKNQKKLKRYDVINNSVIEMHDTANWPDQSSGSETD